MIAIIAVTREHCALPHARITRACPATIFHTPRWVSGVDRVLALVYFVDTCRYREMTVAAKALHMELTVAKWGNSLAVRLPAESAKKMGVGEGDTLIAEVSPDGRLFLAPEGRVIDKAEARRLRRFISRQKETLPVVADMRRGARY